MNTLAQAEVRRNRLKNNTTRLSSAPDQAICNSCHKRKLAGYPPVSNNLNPSFSHGTQKVADQGCLPILFPVPMNIGGDELQPGHASISFHVEDDTRSNIAQEVLRVRLWKQFLCL